MPDTAIPVIPTVPVTPAVLDALRAIVGEKGLILDEQGKQPFVTRLARLAGRQRGGGRAAGQHRGSLQGRKALLRQRHRHRAPGRQYRPDGRRHAVADPQRHRAVARPHEPRDRGRSGRLFHDRRGGLRPADPAGDGGEPRPLLSAQPGRPGLVHDRRQSLDQCRRRAGAALRQRPQPGAGPRSGAAQRRGVERPARAQEGQYRLRPEASVHGRRGHARQSSPRRC